MDIVFATGSIVAALSVVTLIGMSVAKRLDRKYGTELKR